MRRPARRHRALVVSQGPARGPHRHAKSATRFARTTSSRALSGPKANACASRRSSSKSRGETQLWADSFERPTADSLLVQSDVATQIVRSVAMELLPDRAPDTIRRNAAASTRTRPTSRVAITGIGRATKASANAWPSTARRSSWIPASRTAHGALARATVAAADYYLREPREALDAAEAAAARALALDPIDPEALVALAEVRRCRDWDWDGAEEVFRRALDRSTPATKRARRLYGLLLSARGRHEDAVAMTDRALRTRPALPDREHERRMGPFRRGRVRRGHRAVPAHDRHGSGLPRASPAARRGPPADRGT